MKGNLMGELNIGSERIFTVIQCKVKSDPAEFKKWIKDRASKYVYELKEEKNLKKKIQSAMNGFYLMMGVKQH